MEDAPAHKILDIFESEIYFLNQGFNVKLNNEDYIMYIGTIKDPLFIKVTWNHIKNIYQSYLIFEQLKTIYKINDIFW